MEPAFGSVMAATLTSVLPQRIQTRPGALASYARVELGTTAPGSW
jgi:hypothetical protein